jgi:hypothetical protein
MGGAEAGASEGACVGAFSVAADMILLGTVLVVEEMYFFYVFGCWGNSSF